MYTIKDIDIFILSHNRVAYLERMLQSLANQSVNIQGAKVTVLGNDCANDTSQIVNKYPFARYIPTLGQYGNYYKAMELVNKEYIMLLHDDDVIHPQYFERIVNMLNFLKGKLVLLGAGYTNFYQEQEITCKLEKPLGSTYYIAMNNQSFSEMILSGFCKFCYASAIFRTEFYKKLDNLAFMEKYGRLADFFIMAEILKQGMALILQDDKAYFHRLHPLSDTNNQATRLSPDQFDRVVMELAHLTRNFKGFSLKRIWDMFEEYYNHTNGKLSYKQYMQYAQLFKNKKNLLLCDIYNQRHKNIFHYIQYLIQIKCRANIKREILYTDFQELTQDTVLIEKR